MRATETEYFRGPDLYRRYGISHQTLWRWQNSPEMGFPQPRVINRRRYFARDEIEAWDSSRTRKAPVAAAEAHAA